MKDYKREIFEEKIKLLDDILPFMGKYYGVEYVLKILTGKDLTKK